MKLMKIADMTIIINDYALENTLFSEHQKWQNMFWLFIPGNENVSVDMVEILGMLLMVRRK